MKILLVEDEVKVASFIKKGLEEQMFQVDLAYDGAMGMGLFQKGKYDLVILDLILPVMNGLAMCKGIRQIDHDVPILMVTALSTIENKVEGLDAGADDYLTKPFRFEEMLARIRALSRRKTREIRDHVLNFEDLSLDTFSKRVSRGEKNILLTPKEFALLEYFLRNPGKVLSRIEISERIWDIHFDTGTNVIDVYVNYLRKKVDKGYPNKLIHTVFGMGYVLKIEDRI